MRQDLRDDQTLIEAGKQLFEETDLATHEWRHKDWMQEDTSWTVNLSNPLLPDCHIR